MEDKNNISKDDAANAEARTTAKEKELQRKSWLGGLGKIVLGIAAIYCTFLAFEMGTKPRYSSEDSWAERQRASRQITQRRWDAFRREIAGYTPPNSQPAAVSATRSRRIARAISAPAGPSLRIPEKPLSELRYSPDARPDCIDNASNPHCDIFFNGAAVEATQNIPLKDGCVIPVGQSLPVNMVTSKGRYTTDWDPIALLVNLPDGVCPKRHDRRVNMPLGSVKVVKPLPVG